MKPGARMKEDALVRRIHALVGGPSRLSTYDDPAHVRAVVIAALASEAATAPDRARVARGELTAFERRVVRTVTNRGAAVRSRMRQRRELSRLRDELRAKDARLAQLERALAALAAAGYPAHAYAPPPEGYWAPPAADDYALAAAAGAYEFPVTCSGEAVSSGSAVSAASLPPAAPPAPATVIDENLDRDMFGSIIDQLIAPPA